MSIPADLVPLSRIASRLGVPAADLRKLSADGRFPPVYEPLARRYRVSESEVAEWLGTQSEAAKAATRSMRAAWVAQRSRERWAESRISRV